MLVFDRNRFGTKREIDPNGYLRVSACNITKAQVRIYYGKEIPGWKDFNLDPDKIYNVYCPAEELKKALETFNNLPLTREHIEVNVNNVPKDKIVGSLGDSAQFKNPYVQNSIIVYDQKDIDWIMSGRKRELSCGYTYTPVQQSGEFNGLPYDFIMTEIVGNHVALVKEGRAGHDVMVADECPEEMACDGGQGSGNFGHSGRPGEVGGSSNVVDLSKDFDHNPTIDEVKKYLNEVIEEGKKFITESEDYLIDVPHGQRNKSKIANRNNFLNLKKKEFQRHNKYVISLEKILQRAKHVGEKENFKKDKKEFVEKYHYFETNVKINDKIYNLIIDTEQWAGESEIKPQTFHLYNLKENNSSPSSKDRNLDYKSRATEDIIAQDFDAVKNKFYGGVTSQSLSLDNQQHLRSDNPREDILTQDSENVNSESEFNPNFTENENNNKLLDKGEESMVNDEFKEADHPRDKDGKFTTAGGGSEGKSHFLEEGISNEEDPRKVLNHGTINYKGSDIDYIKEKGSKYISMRIYAPKGKTFKNGDMFYETEAEADKAEELAKKIIDNEFGGEGSEKTTNDAMSKEDKIGVVMKEFKDGELKFSSGEKVTDPKQAKAIALSEADRMAKDEIPAKAGKPEKAGEEEALNKGEEKMAEEVKEAIAEKVKEAKEEKVVEDACGKGKDAKGAKDEGIDKRKLIDEIGGILKGKLEEELWRTVMKKAEELAYNDSERSADDKKPVKDEAEKDLKGKEKEAFAEGVDFGEKKEKEEPKKLDSEHESEGTKKADEKEEKAEDKKEAKDKCTMDSQIVTDIDAIKAQVREEVMADFKARENARKAVRSIVGDVNVMAFDSAEDIYKFACEKAGMDLNEIVSFKDAFRGLSAAKGSKLALDASPISGSNEECFKGIRIA